MSLASPLWLLLSALGLLVVALHLRRRRTVEVPSVRLWQRVADASRARASRRPRANLLMLLQLLAVLLVALALARPLWGNAPSWDHWIVVLDTSGSMQATDASPSRFAAAREKLQQMLADQWRDHGRVSVVAAGLKPYIAGARLDDVQDVQAVLDGLRPDSGPASWRDAAALLPSLVKGDEAVRVSILTDGADNGAARQAISAVLPNATIGATSVGSVTSNTGLTAVTVSPMDLKEGRWQVAGQLERFADAPGEVPVTLLFEPQGSEGALPWVSETVPAKAGARAAFSFEVTLPGPGVLEVRLPDDPFGQDNHAYFVLRSSPRSARVLHIGPSDPPLNRALQAVPNLELFQADTLPDSSEDYDLVIVDQTRVPRHPDTNTLWLGVMPPGSEPSATLAHLESSGWNDDHPLSASVDWSALSVDRALQMPRLPGAEVLLEAAGSPLVQVRTTGYGREVVTSFALQDTNWPELVGFPAFVTDLVHWLVPGLGQAVVPTCQAGQVCPLDPRWLVGSLRLLDPQGELVPLPHVFPEGRKAAWRPSGFTQLFRPQQAGLYTLRSQDGTHVLAVNALYPEESDLRPPGEDGSSRVKEAAAGALPALPVPLWFWPLLLALLVLVLEGWLAGRTSERFLRRSSLARGNPLAPRRRLILVLRLLSFAFLVLALLKVPTVWPTRVRHAVFVVDDPQLYGARSRAALDRFVTSAIQATGRSDPSGLVRLGARSRVVDDLGPQLRVQPGDLQAATPGADLERALTLAAAMLPKSAPGRIVLASSALQTSGNAAEVLSRLADRGIPVDVYPVGGVPDGEVLVEDVKAPPRLLPQAPFELDGIVYAERATSATLKILRMGEVLTEQAVELQPGRNRVETTVQEKEPGSYLYEMEVAAEEDVFPENNRAGVLAEVAPAPKIAIFTPQPAWGEVLAKALELQGSSPQVLTPDRFPWQLEDLLAYDAIILMNVPAIDLHSTQQDLLERWVQDFGGGLVLLGGENTFGPGGYYQTAFERLSPLSSRVPREAPKVAMLFVLDRSGSMQQRVGDVTRLDIAKQAALEAVGLLNKQSLVGVTVFDSEASVLAPLQPVTNKEALAAELASLQPGGGTSIYPALVKAFEQMQGVDAMTRHIVVMTDGLSQAGNFGAIMRKMADAGITVSTVAIGQGADTGLLKSLAQLGGGAFHATTDFRALPSILAQEALSLSNSLIRRKVTTPQWLERDVPFVAGMPDTLPPLHGYVRTKAKPQATVELVGPEDAPLLASWRYGLGRVVAFASQGAGSWSADWLGMPDYPLLWSQVVHWVLPATGGPGLHLDLARHGDKMHVTAEALQQDGSVDSGLELFARVTPPSTNHAFDLALTETSPGRYEGAFRAEKPGRYQVKVAPNGVESENLRPADSGLYVSYPARYRFSEQGTGVLAALAHATGGRVLLGDEALFPNRAPLRWQVWPAWPLWALVALALLVADLLLRYAASIFGQRPRRRGLRPASTATRG